MASYQLFKDSIEQAEGGYQNFVEDKGNYNSLGDRVGTNYGVSARFYEDVMGFPPSMEDIKNITKTEAHILFKNEFWDKVKADEILDQGVAEMIADHAINAGTGSAAKITQQTLNNYFGKQLTIDGSIGSLTLQAINAVDPNLLFDKLASTRLENYKTKSDYEKFGHAWRNRVNDLILKFGVEVKKKRMCS